MTDQQKAEAVERRLAGISQVIRRISWHRSNSGLNYDRLFLDCGHTFDVDVLYKSVDVGSSVRCHRCQ